MFDPRHHPILLIDDEDLPAAGAAGALSDCGYPVARARSTAEALALAGERTFDLVAVALHLVHPEPDRLLEEFRRVRPLVPIVVLSEPGDVLQAVTALRWGYADYLLRPPSTHEIRVRLNRLMERRDRMVTQPHATADPHKRTTPREFIARSRAMEAVLGRIARIAPMRSTVLILGESGVGKELVARAIHLHSLGKAHPFVALNCSAIPESLIESELFGHEKGAFTGAVARAPGKFELAHGGTLFLDEIGEMRRETQAKLLRVLEEKEFMRVGGDQNVRVDVRVLAATNADLETLVRQGRFRQDLYFRLKVITIPIPSLRERTEDIPDLARLFLDEICKGNGLAPRKLSDGALAALLHHGWPGNVREMKNVLESAVVGGSSVTIEVSDLPYPLRGAPEPSVPAGGAGGIGARAVRGASDSILTMAEAEREAIRAALERMNGNRTHAARVLGIGVRTLQRKIRQFGMPLKSVGSG